MNTSELKKVQKSIKTIAEKENISPEDVRSEIKAAISEGLRNPDPAVKAMWEHIPCKGGEPEPEELIAWLVEQVRGKMKNNILL